jgi:carbonic anhydrase
LGQSPDALFIACSDSRVVPNLFASTEPGDLFVVRNVGNIVAPCGEGGRSLSDESEAAAIEFAAIALRVSDIIVCGHSECGAMRTLEEENTSQETPHLNAWLRHAQGALRQVRDGDRMKADLSITNHISQFNVLHQLEHLRTYPTVRGAWRTDDCVSTLVVRHRPGRGLELRRPHSTVRDHRRRRGDRILARLEK